MFHGQITLNQISRKASTLAPRKRVVVIGSGWAGYRAALDLDKTKFDVNVISPRNHFLFTPLLPSTAVGTVEFRAIQEPVRTIPGIHYFQAIVDNIDFEKGSLACTDNFKADKHQFNLEYDALILAPGSETNTFGVPGVENNEYVFFLKQLQHARQIRDRLIECFERASSPGTSAEERNKLLTFVVVGGGPTSVEFTSELHDFIKDDVSRLYPDLATFCNVYIVEATDHILGSFNVTLAKYVEKLFTSRNIHVLTSTSVKEVKSNSVFFSDGSSIDFGLMVWSTGVKQVPLIHKIDKTIISKSKNGRLEIDEFLRVIVNKEKNIDNRIGKNVDQNNNGSANGNNAIKPVFGLGDCAGNKNKPLPCLAQVASQQAKYISDSLNKHGIEFLWNTLTDKSEIEPFRYKHFGSMASVGEWKGVIDSTSIDSNNSVENNKNKSPVLKGFLAFALWRSAYWTMQVSISNKILILMYWFKTAVFGRDISRF